MNYTFRIISHMPGEDEVSFTTNDFSLAAAFRDRILRHGGSYSLTVTDNETGDVTSVSTNGTTDLEFRRS